MNLHLRLPRRGESGQTLVLFAGGLIALIAMVGLVIDGGNAYVQQRVTQNGLDAAAEAGTVQLARRLLGVPGTDAEWDQRVADLVNVTATSNSITRVDVPSYVDHDGTDLGPVGTGTIPANTQGVRVGGSRDFQTYFAGVIGLSQFTASATATAITGYVEGSGVGGLMPLTFPILLTQCESGGGSDRLFYPDGGVEWPVGPENVVAIPLCSNGPGNVGWIDWYNSGGANVVRDSILNPNNPPIRTPHWYQVNETGVQTTLDAAMDTWEGKDIQFPIFHVQVDDPGTPGVDESQIGTCRSEPGGTKNSLADCPAGDYGFTGTGGWYFLVSFGEFRLLHSYLQGNHQAECNDTSTLASTAGIGTGNLPNNCLIGYFKSPVVAAEFEVGSGTTPPTTLTPVSVQLIR